MAFNIMGWVEVDRTVGDGIWVSLINISSLIDVPDLFSESVFGFSKGSVSANLVGLFKNRGMPINPSDVVIFDFKKYLELNNSDGLTYVYWEEIENNSNLTPKSEWFVVKQCIDSLIQKTPGLNSKYIRVITWYCW